MNFAAAVAEVLGTTKRPDKLSVIRREINSAISFYTIDSAFPQDLQEHAISINAQEYTQSFSLAEMTRFRRFRYIKRGGTKCHLSVLSQSEMEKGCFARDKYYMAGTAVNVSLAALAATLDVGYYSYPALLVKDTDTHWLLDMAPFMIIDRAMAVVFRDIGEERSMQSHMLSAREAYLAFLKDQAINS